MKLDHVALRVADLDRSIAFYEKMFGLEMMFRQVDEEHHEAFAFLKVDGGNLELLQMLDENNEPLPYEPPDPDASNCPHLAFQTADLSGMVGGFTKKGVPILKGPLEISGQVRWVYALDPDKNILEVVQWLGEDD